MKNDVLVILRSITHYILMLINGNEFPLICIYVFMFSCKYHIEWPCDFRYKNQYQHKFTLHLHIFSMWFQLFRFLRATRNNIIKSCIELMKKREEKNKVRVHFVCKKSFLFLHIHWFKKFYLKYTAGFCVISLPFKNWAHPILMAHNWAKKKKIKLEQLTNFLNGN